MNQNDLKAEREAFEAKALADYMAEHHCGPGEAVLHLAEMGILTSEGEKFSKEAIEGYRKRIYPGSPEVQKLHRYMKENKASQLEAISDLLKAGKISP